MVQYSVHEQCFLILTIALWGKCVHHSEDSYPSEGHSERKLWIRCSKLCAPTLRLLPANTSNAAGGAICARGQQVRRKSKNKRHSQPDDVESPALWVTMTSLLIFSFRRGGGAGGWGEKRRLLSRGPWELQVGRPGVVQQGFRSPYSCSQGPAVGLQRVLGQVGHRVALGGADANGNIRSSFLPMPPPFPNEFCIPPPPWGHMGWLKNSINGASLSFIISTLTSWMSASKFGTDKSLPKDFLSENNGLNGPFDKWLRFHFLLPLSSNYFSLF